MVCGGEVYVVVRAIEGVLPVEDIDIELIPLDFCSAIRVFSVVISSINSSL